MCLQSSIHRSDFYHTAPCADPGVPYQGNRSDQDFRHGRTVRFTCPTDYFMEGVAAITCREGKWSNKKPSCKGTLTEFLDSLKIKEPIDEINILISEYV